MFVCYYCQEQYTTFEDIIHHAVVFHSEKPLSIKENVFQNQQKSILRSIHFNIIPNEETRNGKTIISFANNTIHIVDIDDELCIETPQKRQKCTATERPESSCEEISKSVGTQTDHVVVITVPDTTHFNEIDSFSQILPEVVETLIEYEHVAQWKLLFVSVARKILPKNNIAYRLFLNVVSWFMNENTTAMRYDDVVKCFWRTGLQLFKGKFLRFMSGLKNEGQVVSKSTTRGNYSPLDSQINFAVPSRELLGADTLIAEHCKSPGIMVPVIKHIAQATSKYVSYKLCVDLKKLNPGGDKGDVDCFGYEKTPTLMEKKTRLEKELSVIGNLKNGHQENQVLDSPKADLIRLATIISTRTKDLNELLSKRQYSFDKLIEQCGPKWKESKLAHVLSSVQMTIIDTKECINLSLKSTDVLLSVVTGHKPTADGIRINLDTRRNYVCLTDQNCEINMTSLHWPDYCPLIKQRSKHWMEVRKQARVTGSTAYAALGFETLKAQKQHYEHVIKGKELAAVEPLAAVRMKHGSDNEINAVATILDKVMPAIFPDHRFFEEGCYVIPYNERTLCVVSPDGSIRKDNKVVCAVEIKCPFPEKQYSRKMMYEIPQRYVLQVMLEMHVLRVKQ